MAPVSTTTDPRSRLKDAQRALVLEAILDGAESAFASDGYDNAKVQDIAAEAGVSLAKLYTTFPGKWDLYRAVHKRRLDVLMSDITQALRDAGDIAPLDQLLLAHGLHTRFHMEHVQYLRMHLQDRIVWSSSEGLRCEEQQVAWEAGLRMMIRSLKRGRKEGSIVDEDPELLARSALALQQVQLALWVDQGMKHDVQKVVGTLQRQLLRMLCPADRFAAELVRLEAAPGGALYLDAASGASP